MAARLHALLDGFHAAPFTLQRLCEVLLEPRKQYARLDKVVRACCALLLLVCAAVAAGARCDVVPPQSVSTTDPGMGCGRPPGS